MSWRRLPFGLTWWRTQPSASRCHELVVSAQATTLLDYHHAPHRTAENGKQGAGDMRHGANAADLRLGVPNGTIVKSSDGEVLVDLVGEGAEFVIAAGGRGGLGNAALGRLFALHVGLVVIGIKEHGLAVSKGRSKCPRPSARLAGIPAKPRTPAPRNKRNSRVSA